MEPVIPTQANPTPLFKELPAVGMLQGWKRNLAAFACGVMATLSLPPFFLIPLLVPAFTGLIWILNGATSRRRAFWDGWWWGWGFYMSGLYWFCIALLTDAEKFAWLIPFALFGLTGVIALYSAVACLLFTYVRAVGIFRIYIFSIIWLSVEYARGHLFTGFPWNLAGYSFGVFDASLQLASVVGIYGLTWVAVLLAMLPAALGDVYVDGRRAIRVVAVAYALLVLGVLWGSWRLDMAGETRYMEGPRLRLVQASIAQHHKWDPSRQVEGLKEHALLTQSKGIGAITHVIWPETAVPYVVKAGSGLTQMLGAVLPPDALLITGALRAEGEGKEVQIWNSVVALDAEGNIIKNYDKHKLVPFGEFLPFRSLLPKVLTTPVGEKDFSTGRQGVTLEIPDESHAMLPLICYEAIFPDMTTADPSFAPPTWMLNLTNDAWFGVSSAPYQHFEMSRMRAVEKGLPLIRVANTGISAVIDPYGRVTQKLGIYEKGIIDTGIPEVAQNATWYSKAGDAIFGLLLIFTTAIASILKNRLYFVNRKN